MMMRERIPAIANASATMRNMPNGDAVNKPNGPPGSLPAAGLGLVFCASPCANSATCESATCCCRVESACVSSGPATAPSRLRTPTCGAGFGHFTVAEGDGATCCADFCKLPSAVGTTCISGEELAAATSDAGAEIDLAGGASSVDSCGACCCVVSPGGRKYQHFCCVADRCGSASDCPAAHARWAR